MELIKTSENNGCKVFIAAAGMAAHSAATHSTRPVIGIPIESAEWAEWTLCYDALFSCNAVGASAKNSAI